MLRGGPIIPLTLFLKSSLHDPTTAGRGRRSGELLPCGMLLSGARTVGAGILLGLGPLGLWGIPVTGLWPDTEAPKFVLAAEAGLVAADGGRAADCGLTEAAKGLRALVGVCDLGGGPRSVPLRLAGGAVLTDLGCVAGAWLLGVFDRGPAALAAALWMSSRYRSPWTRNGRPYSSSQLSRMSRKSASTFGSSLAIRFRIFSSLRSLVGSRFSPFCPRIIKRDASCDEAARSSRSLISDRCLSIIASVGARCSLRASKRAISAS